MLGPRVLSAVIASWLFGTAAFSQPVDPQLERLIAATPAIDDHAHPNRCVADGEPPDDEADQIPVEGFAPFPLMPGLDPQGPGVREARHALYGLPLDADETAAIAAKQRAQREHGDGYASWVLDRIGIETMLANRIALGRCLAPPRFAFVPFADAFLFPLDNGALHRESADTSVSVAGAEHLLARYRSEAGAAALPGQLAEYLTAVVTPTLERLRKRGAIAVKFEANYIRPLAFSPVSEADAAQTYARFARGGEPPADDYRRLQDFLFHYVASEAGRLGMAVHLHALGIGAGPGYAGSRWDPWQFESVLNEPSLQNVRFVLVHGGWPWTDAVGALLMAKANLYADISAMTFTLPPSELARVLHGWLSLAPDKVLFGTDAFALTPAVGWEELAWSETRTARRALGLALTQLLRDEEIDRPRAERLARMVLRENALRLYGLALEPGEN
jgi:predicted TIM-barrel fold metal-dependent hydrolase